MPLIIQPPSDLNPGGARRVTRVPLVASKHDAGHRALRRARVVVAPQPLYLAGGRLPTDVAHVLGGAPLRGKQAADWMRLAKAWGSLRRDVALKEASGEPAGRRLSRHGFDMAAHWLAASRSWPAAFSSLVATSAIRRPSSYSRSAWTASGAATDGFMPPVPARKRSMADILPSVNPVVRRSAIDGAALSFDPGAAGDPANVEPVSGRPVVGRPDAGRFDNGRLWLVGGRLPGTGCGCGLVLGGRDAEPSLVDGQSSIRPCTLPSSIESS